MAEGEQFLLALGLLYLWETLLWIPRGTVAVAAGRRRPPHLRHAGNLLSNQRGAILPAPLPFPFSRVQLCLQFPFSFSPAGLLGCTATFLEAPDQLRHSGLCLPWEAIRQVATKGRRLYVNHCLLSTFASPATARHFARILNQARQAHPDIRPGFLKAQVRQMLDPASARLAWRHVTDRMPGALTWVPLSGLVTLFVIGPLLAWLAGPAASALPFGLLLLVQSAACTCLYHRAHRRLYPGERQERFVQTLSMLLLPPLAFHAAERLRRHALEPFHFLALAQLLLPPKSLRRVARDLVADLRCSLLPVDDSLGREIHRWFHQTACRAVEQTLQRSHCKVPDWQKAPLPSDPGNLSYCPRCGTQYTRPAGQCRDCGGLVLKALGQPAAAA